jgi:hypothetical protein
VKVANTNNRRMRDPPSTAREARLGSTPDSSNPPTTAFGPVRERLPAFVRRLFLDWSEEQWLD